MCVCVCVCDVFFIRSSLDGWNSLEHHLGLTCDPIDGYVQIPCIERNAVAALRAIDAAKLASYIGNTSSKISFDMVVDTMLATGKDLHVNYRETSEGGLAKKYR